MSIRAEWIVEVDIPQIVFDTYRDNDNCPYAHEVNEAIKGFIDAGEIFYNDPYRYVHFHTKEEAEACEKKLIKIMYKYEKMLSS